jgi:FkbM family methyltransferase
MSAGAKSGGLADAGATVKTSKRLITVLVRLSSLINGLVRCGNPLHVALSRKFRKNGLMTISDRRSGVTLEAAVQSYGLFRETWYYHDYDVPACPLRPNDSVIDIGANQGFFSCYAASKGAHVHAFEPFPESCMRLRSNVERNGFSSHVTISQLAVSAVSSKATLRCSDFLGGGANTIVESHANALAKERGVEFKQTIEIETVSMDAILSRIPGRIRLCKLDCEGSEFDLILSISDPSRIDSIAMEFHLRSYLLRDLIGIIAKWGTHQISFAKSGYILYAVRNEILSEYGADIDSGLLPFEPKRSRLG